MSIATLPTFTDYQTRPAWLSARRNHIGSSDAAAILGEGYRGQSPFTIWMEKTGKCENELEGEWLECGQVLQDAILKLAERRIERPVVAAGEFTIYHHPSIACMGASLDGRLADVPAIIPVEAKNVDGVLSRDWNDDEPPLKFNIQVQHQMACTGAEFAYVVGLIGGNRVRVKSVARNDRFISALQERIEEFWECVTRDVPPEVDASKATADAIYKLYSNPSDTSCDLPPDADAWAVELDEAKLAIKQAEEIKTLNENRLKAAIGSNSVGYLPSGGSFSWREQTRKEYVCKASTFRVLRYHRS